MTKFLALQPDSYPIAGARMAMDAAPRSRSRGARDEDLDDAFTLDPAEGLRKYIDGMLGTDHPHRDALMRMIDQLARTDSEADTEVEAEDRRRAMDASRAHDGSHAGRARAAAHARSIATDASLHQKFPDLRRIRSA